MPARRANYRVVNDTSEAIVIRDMGPWDQHPTVTNDAENVVQDLLPRLNGRRLLCIDSEGDCDEMLVKDGKFDGWYFLPQK